MGWERIPEDFVQFNTAVIAFRGNEKIEQVLRAAVAIADEIFPLGYHDQAAIRRALWLAPGVQMYTLAPTWQCRNAKTCAAQVSNHIVWGVEGEVYAPCIIIHAHGLQHTA